MTDNNIMSDSIPSEVGLLTGLTELSLSKRFISIHVLYFETKRIGSMVLTISLSFSAITL